MAQLTYNKRSDSHSACFVFGNLDQYFFDARPSRNSLDTRRKVGLYFGTFVERIFSDYT